MKKVNLLENLPEWTHTFGSGLQNDKGTIAMVSASDLYRKIAKPDFDASHVIACRCGCDRKMRISWYGLNSYFPWADDGDDTINFTPEYVHKEGVADNLDISNFHGDLDELATFLQSIKEAIKFKAVIVNDIYYKIRISPKNSSNTLMKILVVKNEGRVKVLLYELSANLPIVLLKNEAETFRDYMGVIYDDCSLSEEELTSIKDLKESEFYKTAILAWAGEILKLNGKEKIAVRAVIETFLKEKSLEKA